MMKSSRTLLKTANDVIATTEARFVPVYAKQKIVFTEGKGVFLKDDQGKEYLDLYSGVAVNSLGHAHPDFLKTLHSQSSKLMHVSNIFYNAPAAELSDELCKSSFASSVFFCNSGTEANEGALKFARKYSTMIKNDKIEYVSFHGGFHGRSMGALSVTANPKYQEPYRPLIPGVHHVNLNDLPSLQKVMSEKTSAVIIEPIQGEGGVNCAKKDFVLEVRHLCDKYNALLIFDEIQCGMGRTGQLWGHQEFGVEPDIMTVAKALGNGFPIGAILVNKKVSDSLKFGDHGSTFGGQPLACALGKTVLNTINQPSFLKNVTETGEYFQKKLKEINSPLIKEIRGRGLILGIEIDLQKAGVENLSGIMSELTKEGVVGITAGGNVIRIVPPLILEKVHVDLAVDALSKVLKSFPKK